MPTIYVTDDQAPSSGMAGGFHELDRVRLVKSVVDKETALGAGLVGTIVLCHGADAYEVEFDGIDDFFQIAAQDLKKLA